MKKLFLFGGGFVESFMEIFPEKKRKSGVPEIFVFAVMGFFFAPNALFAATSFSGILSADTTWTAEGNPYVIGNTIIPAGVTLTVEEGVVVKFADQRASIEVNGNLKVRGGAERKVFFTSLKDDSVDGDTNGDGASSTPQAEDWGNILVRSGGVAEIDHAGVRFGGYTGWQLPTSPANFSTIGGTLLISHSEVGKAQSAVIHSAGNTFLSGNTFIHTNAGVSAGGVGHIVFTQNTFTDTINSAVQIDLSGGITFSNSGSTASGGIQNGFSLRGTVNTDLVFGKDTMPYIIEYLDISAGKKVTLESGAILKFASERSQILVSGKLDAMGTENEPVYFTSLEDDAVGGDTNGDGASSTPKARDWAEIGIFSGGEANFENTVVRSGGYTGWQLNTTGANIANRGGVLNITSSEILDGNTGVHHVSGTTTLFHNAVRENVNGISSIGSGSLTLTNTIFSDSTGSPAYLDFSQGLLLSNSGNTVSGASGERGFNIRGTLANDLVLAKDEMPYLLSHLSVPAEKTLTVRPGAVIKMEAINAQISVAGTLNAIGTADEPIYFTSIKDDAILGDTNGDGNITAPQSGDWAEIALAKDGTANFSNAIIRYGGQYSWGIWTDAAEIANRGGTLIVNNSEISHGNIGLYHTSGISIVSQSFIHHNASYGIFSKPPLAFHVNAKNNYWGSPTGPTHASNPSGTGDKVSNYVDFFPFLGSDPLSAPVPLGVSASNLAKQLVHENYLWGGKGWDMGKEIFVETDAVKTRYEYRASTFGNGVDCSGLVGWSYNRTVDPEKDFTNNFIKYLNANEQYQGYKDNTISESELQPGDLLFFDRRIYHPETQTWTIGHDGIMDHVAMYVGDQGGYDVIEAASKELGIISSIKQEAKSRPSFVAFARPKNTIIAMSVRAHSPIHLSVTDPDGNTVSDTTIIASPEEFIRESGDLYYATIGKDANGYPEDIVYSPILKPGAYRITVAPMAGVPPDQTYSLEFSAGSTTIELAKNVRLSDIPTGGYGIAASADGTVVFDTTPPEAHIGFSTSTQNIHITGTDDLSLAPKVSPSATSTKIADDAGNTLTLATSKNVAKENHAVLVIPSFSYSTGTTTLATTSLRYFWRLGKAGKSGYGHFISSIQTPTERVLTIYVPLLNKTHIIEGNPEDDDTDLSEHITRLLSRKKKRTLDGLVIPSISTKNGGIVIVF